MYTVFQPFSDTLVLFYLFMSFIFAQFNIKTETGTVHLAWWVIWAHTIKQNISFRSNTLSSDGICWRPSNTVGITAATACKPNLHLPSDCSECIWSRTPRLDRWLNGSQSRREGPVLFWVEEVSFRGSGIMTGLSHFPREIKSSFPLDCPAGENVWMRRVGVSATSSRRHPLWRPAWYRLMGFWDSQGKNHGMCCVPTLFPVPQWATILQEFYRVNRKPWGFLCRLILYRGFASISAG